MTIITAIELAGAYPEEILITSSMNTEKKHGALCYRIKDGDIHRLMLSSDYVFESAEIAEEWMHDIAKDIKQKYS